MIPQADIAVEEIADEKSPAQRNGRCPSVWLVDDCDDFRALLAKLLSKEGGFDCARNFSSPQQVIAALMEETPPDVILLDVQMGEECGLDAIEPIKFLAESTHVIMLTTCFDSLSQTAAQRNGATDFLLKSFSAERIASRIWQAMEQPVPLIEKGVKKSDVPQEKSCPSETAVQLSIFNRLANWKAASVRILRGALFFTAEKRGLDVGDHADVGA
jgi:DNA-binding NtrC family response regulator